ncbi:MAG: 16S rRNA (guanine(527)-N(7))-methyltransferase RsmG [Microbacteriaceae bacterium]
MIDESKEYAELEPEPQSASVVFGDTLPKVRDFTQLLFEQGELRGLIGVLEPARLWTRHIINSGLLAPLLRPGRVGDVGSGAGLPGVVLAIARPDVELILIEPMIRRVEWLQEVKHLLHLDNVTVVRDRAEDYQPQPMLDQVTARAVSALRTLIPITAPLLRPGGELLLMKGERVDQELAAAEKVLRKYRLTGAEVLVLGDNVDTEPTRVFRASVSE